MGIGDYIWLGVLEVFTANPAFFVLGLPITMTVLMVLAGFLTGILAGATPGLSGPFVMAVSLPILISIFGITPDALLPVMGFLVGVMKGATIGGAVPAILFNTPGTPDSLLTTFDGYPMAKKGQAGKALRVAHFSSATGDTVSDMVLFLTAPFLAVLVEAHLGFTEKAALIILSLSFVAAVVGKSVTKGLLSALLGLFLALVATGEDLYPRLSLGMSELSQGFPLVSAVLGVLILGEVICALEDMMRDRLAARTRETPQSGDNKLHFSEIRRLLPTIGRSAAIGTVIGALPGIGSTLAATLGYTTARAVSKRPQDFGKGIPEGVAATEAANSSVSGANLIPVLSLGIPGNVAAVFLILATESIGGFNPGPSVFRFTEAEVNTELVMAFGLFTAMVLANIFNWTIGGGFMRLTGILVRIPKHYLMPVVLLITLTSIYVERTSLDSLYIALAFGVLGYLMRRLDISVLPFVIAFILANNLEEGIRRAFSASGNDPFFFFHSPISIAFFVTAIVVIYVFGIRARKRLASLTAADGKTSE
jgi:putative tricarboxylic transport membrane protein